MPGLIDSHVHLAFDASACPVEHMMGATDHQLLVTMLHSARCLLEAGVTTARDHGARSYLDVVVRDAITAGLATGPNLLVANRPITTTGGHCWFMGCECDDVLSVRRAVRDHHKAGAEWVKIMATGGMMTSGSAPWFAQFTDTELSAAVDEARRLGMRVAAHAHGTPGIVAAAQAGVDTIEHCSFIGQSERTLDMEVVTLIANQGVAVCPTTNLRWNDLPAEFGRSARDRIDAFRAYGVPIIAGTDCGINLVPHGAYAEGLLTLERLGMPPGEVLAAATSVAADALGIGDVTGQLTPGRRADLVALDRDPLDDLTATRDVAWVMSNGTATRRFPAVQV
jgi:imidazolonepropionase-like amidohydrolase